MRIVSLSMVLMATLLQAGCTGQSPEAASRQIEQERAANKQNTEFARSLPPAVETRPNRAEGE
ncbi:MAG: hypothetical protein ABI871_01740 [Chthoniobacterales bacterium]